MIERRIRCDECYNELKPWELISVRVQSRQEGKPTRAITLHFCHNHEPHRLSCQVDHLLHSIEEVESVRKQREGG